MTKTEHVLVTLSVMFVMFVAGAKVAQFRKHTNLREAEARLEAADSALQAAKRARDSVFGVCLKAARIKGFDHQLCVEALQK